MLSGAPVFAGGPDEVLVDELALDVFELDAVDVDVLDAVDVDVLEEDEPPGRHSGGPRKGGHIPVLDELVNDELVDVE